MTDALKNAFVDKKSAGESSSGFFYGFIPIPINGT